MKKLILFVSFAICAASLNAQTATTTTGAKAPATGKVAAKDLMLCKNWNIVAIEEWGVVTKPPGDKNKSDMMKLGEDGKYDLVMFSTRHMGTWTKTGQTIYFVDDGTKFKFTFKILSVDDKKLKVDHFSDEEGHSIFEYEAK